MSLGHIQFQIWCQLIFHDLCHDRVFIKHVCDLCSQELGTLFVHCEIPVKGCYYKVRASHFVTTEATPVIFFHLETAMFEHPVEARRRLLVAVLDLCVIHFEEVDAVDDIIQGIEIV